MDIYFQALGLAALIALVSLAGALVFGGTGTFKKLNRYIAPLAVGVFMALILVELMPETYAASAEYGALAIALGFIAFYILSSYLHKRFHNHEDEHCDRKGAAILLLIGDAIHNMADGIILGGVFLIDPTLAVITAVGLALHELPQEIVEFGILLRAGFSRTKAAFLNLLSASSIIIGTLGTLIIAEQGEQYLWLLTGIAAGNLLFLATSDLLPRIHGNLKEHGGIWSSSISIIIGFIIMTTMLVWSHEQFGYDHGHDNEADHEAEHAHDDQSHEEELHAEQ